ncbi:Maf-domain-containing protein, partial [Atractiella rhizophila]
VGLVSPILETPGYKLHSLTSQTAVHFLQNPLSLLEAYAADGEGVDRAGGFAIQGKGGILIDRIEGDYWNVVGFPGGRFWSWLAQLIEEEEL